MVITSTNGDISGEDIQITVNVLKNHINELKVEKCIISEQDATRSRRIEELMMEEKHLSQQFHRIRKEIRRYERKYEKILKKKVKLMGMQIKDDLYRLNNLKEKYKELNEQLNKNYHETAKEKKEHLKKPCKVRRIKRGLGMFKQKIVPISRKIKIKIKKNEQLGRREMVFVNDSITQQSFPKSVNVSKSNGLNTRECKIVLEKLSDEQVNQIAYHRQNQQKNKQTSVNSSQKNSESETTDKPNWHIKIPKSMFKEIQKDQSAVLNVISPTRNITTRQIQSNAN